jgi:hypothetical protein
VGGIGFGDCWRWQLVCNWLLKLLVGGILEYIFQNGSRRHEVVFTLDLNFVPGACDCGVGRDL